MSQSQISSATRLLSWTWGCCHFVSLILDVNVHFLFSFIIFHSSIYFHTLTVWLGMKGYSKYYFSNCVFSWLKRSVCQGMQFLFQADPQEFKNSFFGLLVCLPIFFSTRKVLPTIQRRGQIRGKKYCLWVWKLQYTNTTCCVLCDDSDSQDMEPPPESRPALCPSINFTMWNSTLKAGM